ncbi:MAG: hypothetical protein ACI9K2_003800 [Myxococcota bacterium]
MPRRPANGIDDDCDTLVDDDDVDPVGTIRAFADMDGDGLGDPDDGVDRCALGERVENDRDCDDADPTVGGPIEVVPDRDGDGFPAGDAPIWGCAGDGFLPPGGPVDCNDFDSVDHPGAIDFCSTPIDEDYSGVSETCSHLDATAEFHGTEHTVSYLSFVGDLNADGRGDWWTYGLAAEIIGYVVAGDATSGAVPDVATTILTAPGSQAMYYIGDVDGDGFDDALVGGLEIGPALHPGPIAGELDAADSPHRIRIPEPDILFGLYAAQATDANGDGHVDLWVGMAPAGVGGGDRTGGVALYAGPLMDGERDDTDTLARVLGEPGEQLDQALTEDLDGDGVPDLVTAGAADHVRVLTGPFSGLHPSDEGVTHTVDIGNLGEVALGDLDYDGTLDLIIPTPRHTDDPRVYVVSSRASRDSVVSESAWLTLTGGVENGLYTKAADLDGDGVTELVMSDPLGDDDARAPIVSTGNVTVLRGPVRPGTYDVPGDGFLIAGDGFESSEKSDSDPPRGTRGKLAKGRRAAAAAGLSSEAA